MIWKLLKTTIMNVIYVSKRFKPFRWVVNVYIIVCPTYLYLAIYLLWQTKDIVGIKSITLRTVVYEIQVFYAIESITWSGTQVNFIWYFKMY